MKSLIMGVIAITLGLATQLTQATTYQVYRELADGRVLGFIETDGTTGVLNASNIIAWELVLIGQFLPNGSPVVISSTNQQQTLVDGFALTATSSELRFDISGASGTGFFAMQAAGFGDYYCIETADAFCTGGGIGEHIGNGSTGVAHTGQPTGNVVIGRVAQPITYSINRQVAAGSIFGTITTNGRMGSIDASDIIDWDLTLSAPNLSGGSPDNITFATQIQTNLSGQNTIASPNDLRFDIDGTLGTGFFLLQGGDNSNYYCIETASAFCTGGGIGEHIGFDATVGGPTETGLPTGVFVFASVAPGPITYYINRDVAAGHISGSITTNGTMGALQSDDVIDWNLTLEAPNLEGGSPDNITFLNQTQTFLDGSVTTASPTDLMFDISGASGEGFFLLQGQDEMGNTFENYYCIETANSFCTGGGLGEHIGNGNVGNAQTAFPTGNFVFASTATSPITYCIDRTIGAGSVVGYITTDGTLGVINSGNVIDWELTLTAPNLSGGSPDVINFANQFQTTIIGNTTTASDTQMFFNIDGLVGEGAMLLQGGPNSNYYCLETATINCTGNGIGEHIGFDATFGGATETALPTGFFAFAEVKQNIVYQVNRRLSAGTVTGFIETDGTIGTLSSANILDWELTLTAPNLAGGPVDTIDFSTQTQTFLDGAVTSATSTGLFFDISGASGIGFFLVQGSGPDNYYCIETADAFCTGDGIGEHMGRGVSTTVAQTGQPLGNFRFATNCVADFTGDGSLDFFDVSAFLTLFNAGQSGADLNIDGSFDFFDVSLFLASYGAGCP